MAKGKPLKMSEICATLEKAFPNHKPEQIQELAAHAYAMQNADAADGDDGGDGGDDSPVETAAAGDETEAQTAARHATMAAERQTKGTVETPAQKAEREAREATEILLAKARDSEREQSRRSGVVVRRLAVSVASDPMVVKMAKRISDLENERAIEKAEEIVNTALRERRIVPAQKEWALQYCKESPAGFQTFIGKSPVFIPQNDGSLRGIPPTQGDVPTGIDAHFCELFKIEPKRFAANKAAFVEGKLMPRRSLSDSDGGGMREVA